MHIIYKLYVKLKCTYRKNIPCITLTQFGILSAVKPVYQPSETGCIVSLNMSQQLIIRTPNIKVINSLAKSQPLPHGRLKRERGTSMKPCIFSHYRPPQVLARGLWRGEKEKKKEAN